MLSPRKHFLVCLQPKSPTAETQFAQNHQKETKYVLYSEFALIHPDQSVGLPIFTQLLFMPPLLTLFHFHLRHLIRPLFVHRQPSQRFDKMFPMFLVPS
jgi:hypothetical protein